MTPDLTNVPTDALLTEVVRRIDEHMYTVPPHGPAARELELAKTAAETCSWRLERSLETQPQPREALRQRLTERRRDRPQPGN